MQPDKSCLIPGREIHSGRSLREGSTLRQPDFIYLEHLVREIKHPASRMLLKTSQFRKLFGRRPDGDRFRIFNHKHCAINRPDRCNTAFSGPDGQMNIRILT